MALPLAQELTEDISIMNTTVSGVGSDTVRVPTSEFASASARIQEVGGPGPTVETMQHESQIQNFEIITQYIEGVRAWMTIMWGSPARQLDITDTPQKIFDRYNRQWLIIHASEYTERDVRE